MPTCISLRERFGGRYKVRYEETYQAEKPKYRAEEEVWLQIIPGARGHVYPHSATMLAATTNTSGPTARRLKALPFVEVWTDGADGVTVLFDPDHVDVVGDLLHLRRRRRISDQERERLAALGRKYGFQARQTGLQTSSEARESTQTAPVDSQDLPRQMPLFGHL